MFYKLLAYLNKGTDLVSSEKCCYLPSLEKVLCGLELKEKPIHWSISGYLDVFVEDSVRFVNADIQRHFGVAPQCLTCSSGRGKFVDIALVCHY